MGRGKTIRRGPFLYDGPRPTGVRIVLSPIRFGTGDYEDPPEISGDIGIDTYCVEYGSTSEKDVFHAGGGGFDALEEASSAAAVAVGGSLVWFTN